MAEKLMTRQEDNVDDELRVKRARTEADEAAAGTGGSTSNLLYFRILTSYTCTGSNRLDVGPKRPQTVKNTEN